MKLFRLTEARQRSRALKDWNDSKFFIQKNEVGIAQLVVEQGCCQLVNSFISHSDKLERGAMESNICCLFRIQFYRIEFFIEEFSDFGVWKCVFVHHFTPTAPIRVDVNKN